jgi:signal transduction histidine kinase
MNLPVHELVSRWGAWPALVTRRLRQAEGPDERGAALAGLLRELVPEARLAACRLGTTTSLAPSEASAVWLPELAGLEVTEPGVRQLTLSEGDNAVLGVAAAVEGKGGEGGFLLIGLPPEQGAAAAEVGPLLGLAAHDLGLQLQVEGLRDELSEWDDLLTVGEAMAGLTHTLNNSLNTMLLQASTLQLRADKSLREDIGVIRREGGQAAARLRPLQQVRESRRQVRAQSDLNAAVRQALAGFPEGSVRAELGVALPGVPAPPIPLRRLTTLLLRVARACQMPADRPVGLRTEARGQEVRLLLQFEGVRVGPEGLNNVTELAADLLGGMHELERTAAQSLARRLGARVRVSDRPEGGVTVAVTWDVAG